jgi:hypothetical protein
MPLPPLLYAHVVKTVRRRRLVQVCHRVVCGTLEAVQQGLAGCGGQSNTAFVARINRTRRPPGAARGRRGSTLCQGEDGWRQQLAWDHVSEKFCRPHAS